MMPWEKGGCLMNSRHARRVYPGLAGALLLLSACATQFDMPTYQGAVQLKYETLALIDQSSTRYALNKAAAEALTRRYADAAETATRIAGNTAVAEQWQAIRD